MGQFRNQLARNEAMRAWRDSSFLAGARVTEEEARAYYDAHLDEATHGDEARALQIMFPLPVLDTPRATEARALVRRKADEALALARSGRDFEDLIRAYMDPLTLAAVDNGQLGWVGRTGSFPELEEVIMSLKPGEVGGPVETSFSLHIVKVLDTREAGTLSFLELRPEITEMLTDAKIDDLVQARSAELLNEAEITVLDPELAAGWEEYRRAGAASSAPPDPASGA
jgi:parvulin-like peptidyl-prolyl isomerase